MANQPINETDYIKDVVPGQWKDGACVGDWIGEFTEEFTEEFT